MSHCCFLFLPLPCAFVRVPRVSELEGLLAAQRAREYRSELDVAKSGGQLGAMQQKNIMLEEQVGTHTTVGDIWSAVHSKMHTQRQ